eukprot:Gb_18302 [translate_table: standard]
MRKTGGLVIWRAGSVILLYRGIDYVPPYVKAAKSLGVVLEPAGSMPSADDTVETEYEREINSILDGLGPRFSDWWGYDPLPVDADLLPEVVPGYKKPFRLLPYGMKPKLTDMEMTSLRRLARPLPPHFALGINEKLQGLAAAMVKLWEKSEIAKIAVKRGVQNTNSEKMAEELKEYASFSCSIGRQMLDLHCNCAL